MKLYVYFLDKASRQRRVYIKARTLGSAFGQAAHFAATRSLNGFSYIHAATGAIINCVSVREDSTGEVY